MSTRLFRAAILASAAFSLIVAASPQAQAEVQYPWCAQYRRPLDATNCGFVSYRQCLATISGVGGICYRNPAYPPPRDRSRRR
jgi:hypothetical protein